jgi:hypothetical protein
VWLVLLMALSFTHGAVQWLSASAATTVYTVSGLSFQPKALRFYMMGLGNAADAVSEAVSAHRGVGFATSTSNRFCVGSSDIDTSASAVTDTVARNDAIATTLDGNATTTGLLDLNSITSDGFTLIVDDAVPADITVFWEAWGGSDITVAVAGSCDEPLSTSNVDYTVTGFVSGATDQIVMFAGVQSPDALNTEKSENSGMSVGFATGGGADAENIVVMGGSDRASSTMDTDGLGRAGYCLAQETWGGGTLESSAKLTQWNTDGFRLAWTTAAGATRRNIFLAIKGGSWKVGSYTIDGSTGSATATVSGLSFAPIGLSLIGRMATETAASSVGTQDRMSLGSGTSTSSRRSMGHLSEDGTANAEIDETIQYDQVLCFPSTAGALLSAYDINAMNSDGFQIIVDTAGGVASEWQGYLTFGDAPAAGSAFPHYYYQQMRAS